MVNQSMADVHQSTTCTLGANGGPCEMCAQANRSTLNPTEQRILTAIRQDRQAASITVIRAAIADVLDGNGGHSALVKVTVQVREADGRVWEHSLKPKDVWLFCDVDEEWQTELRERLIDAVCTRITALQSPPHNMDARLLNPPVTGYGRGYADGWLDAHTETLKAQNDDLKEMQRLTKTKIKEL